MIQVENIGLVVQKCMQAKTRVSFFTKQSQIKKWNSVPYLILELSISDLQHNTVTKAEGDLPIVLRQTSGKFPSAISTGHSFVRIYLL